VNRPLAAVVLSLALGAPTATAQQKPGPAKPPAPVVVSVPKPVGTDFVVLADGTVLEGAVTTTETEVVVTPAGAGERRLEREQVSVALAGGKRVHRGEETGLYLAWRAWLKAAHADQVPSRLIADAEPPAKQAWWRDVLAAADLCAKWKMTYAATALLAEGLEANAWDEEAERRALEWEPVEFPLTPEDAVKAKLLATWAREIVPLGGKWVLRNAAGESRSQLWTTEAIALGTKNVLLFTLDRDPKVVGSSLRQAETTVRGLESLFGKPDVTAKDRIEIRLFEDRKRYLTESDSGHGYAPIWTAGFFSPGEMVSRFYAREKEGGSFVESAFHEVLSHELTHHWIEMRYCAGAEYEGAEDRPERAEEKQDGRRRGDQGGHWIVEGVARFVEDQAILFKRNGFKFDDATAECVRDCAQAWRAGMGIPMKRYIDITSTEFQFLGKGPMRSKTAYVNSEVGVFYDQGGALSFFMMNRRGPDGRKRFIQYLKDVYGLRMSKQGWVRLGFSSAEELEKEFTAFLATVK
jgi:hypothetical protein